MCIVNFSTSTFKLSKFSIATSFFENRSSCRVEVAVTDHVRDSKLDLEKYKAVQIFLVREDRKLRRLRFFFSVILFLTLKLL